jgi:hypothetical protein
MGAPVGSSSTAYISAVVPTHDPACHLGDLYYLGPDAAQSLQAYARSTSFAELLHDLVRFVGHSDGLVIVPIRTGLDATTPWCLRGAFTTVMAGYEDYPRTSWLRISFHSTSSRLTSRVYPVSLQSSEPNAAISSSELPSRSVYQHEGKVLNSKV